MGRKRRLLAARGKFGNKFSAHPRYAGTQTQTTTETTQQQVEDVAIIAEQVETIAQEVVATEQETNEIENYLSKTEITLVPNPLPFQLYENFNSSFEKTFVYFGRIHPIKNIRLIIKSFIESKLYNDGWRLDIFGIKDDEETSM